MIFRFDNGNAKNQGKIRERITALKGDEQFRKMMVSTILELRIKRKSST